MISSRARRAIQRSGLAILLAVAVPLGWAAIVTTPEQTLTFDTLTNTNLSSVTSIITSGYGEFDRVMDDFRYTVAVPEPSSALYMLAGIGLLCTIGARRHLRR